MAKSRERQGRGHSVSGVGENPTGMGEVFNTSKMCDGTSKESTEGTIRRTDGKTSDVTSKDILAWWNGKVSKSLDAKEIKFISKQRLKKFSARLSEIPTLMELFEKEAKLVSEWVREQTFLSFDWLMNPRNTVKFLEGNYREKKKMTAAEKEKAAIRRHFNVDR